MSGSPPIASARPERALEPVWEIARGCVARGRGDVRSEAAADAGHRQGRATRQRPVLVQPEGTSSFAPGTSSLVADDATASPRSSLLARGQRTMSQTRAIAQTGS